MNIAQLIISVPLFLVLAFGIGFIINMLIKTTWLPLAVYVLVLIYLFVKMGALLPVDYIVLTSGLLGAILSGVTIKTLRAKGYRMF
ncbi:YuiB family protein [Ammoniphilus resinae]|uniref:Membrane protein YdbS with pleckstrin-like domain n=1 Tax=Ammoniphilus resinae TaxID=861532 RepID=A0ABS4GUB6_9BACL|nr:membrane protein YdbS with pleckstrin-like domain [Ammoniphilus resinae]